MDDDTLAPFVDALASALIMMVLVSIFFLIQTSMSITESAKLHTVNEKEVDEKTPLFSPIVYRNVVEYDIEKKSFKYIVNFKIKKDKLAEIKKTVMNAKEVKVLIESNDNPKKSVVNILYFIQSIDLSEDVNVTTEIKKSDSALSKLIWETK